MQMTLGIFLKSIRQSVGYSLREVERRSGYSMGYIIAIEKGRRVPTPFALDCIMQSLSLKDEGREQAITLFMESGKVC